MGRTDDMVIIKGVNIFPLQIDKVLMAMPEVGTHYLVELTRQDYSDQMLVKVEVQQNFFQEDLKYLKQLQKRITEALKSELLVTPRVELVEPNTLPRTEGKAQRVVDKRSTEGRLGGQCPGGPVGAGFKPAPTTCAQDPLFLDNTQARC